MRRCIGCRTSFPAEQLIRFTLIGDDPIPDTDGKKDGRGFYLCRNRECLEAAIKVKAFNRICRKNVDPDTLRHVVESFLSDTKEDK